MRIMVTGGFGFIGSNLIKLLNQQGIRDIVVVDNLHNGRKIFNANDLDIADYIDKEQLFDEIATGRLDDIRVVIHLGACSATTEWNGKYVMENNYNYSKKLLNWCDIKGRRFIYASSASVYGLGNHGFSEKRECERPLNMYAYSKWQFDQYVRAKSYLNNCSIVGLRFFNVYGPREGHKKEMASTVYHFANQIISDGTCKLFGGCGAYTNGMQSRDFVYVKDCVKVIKWFMGNEITGIFNLGTGQSRTFNDLAKNVCDFYKSRNPSIEYIKFPQHLKGSYQDFTKADMTNLFDAGYVDEFFDLESGIKDYLSEVDFEKNSIFR